MMIEKDQCITKQIATLFENISEFAAISASIDIQMYERKQFDFYQYPLGVNWVGIRKNQVEGLQQAFAVLFMLDLHDQNDWIYDERFRTNEDQFVIEELPALEWLSLVRDKWIEDYFALKYRSLNVKHIDIEFFQKCFLHWIPENAEKKEVDDLNAILLKTKWVCSLFPDAFYDKYFGETEDYYFFAESGVYD